MSDGASLAPFTAPFTAAMLAGGQGRRMGGADKAFVTVGGVPLAERVRRAVGAAGAAELLAVGGDGPRLAALGWRAVADRWPGQGPLGGVLGALGAASHEAVLVVACDLPFLDPVVLRAVVDALLAGADVDVAVPSAGGRLQVLHAAYRRRAAPVLAARFATGERSLLAALAQLRVRVLQPSELPVPLDVRAFADADTLDDLRGFESGGQP